METDLDCSTPDILSKIQAVFALQLEEELRASFAEVSLPSGSHDFQDRQGITESAC